MRKKRNTSDNLLLILKGIGMGAANKVPGVSGGVVAFVAGFYEEFIYSLQRVNKTAFRLLLTGRLKSFFHYINGAFLSLLISGMIISFFSVSKIIDYFLVSHEILVWSCFFGMILGSVYYINKDFKHWNKTTTTAFLIGIAVGFTVSLIEPIPENRNFLFVFFCGIISVCGMTLPGLSGSFLLILLGNYVLLLVDSVNAVSDTFTEIIVNDYSFIHNPNRIELLKILGLFTIGSIVGLVSLSHVLNYLLRQHKDITYASIIGFISGSLGVVWPWKTKTFVNEKVINYTRYIPNINEYETLLAILSMSIGILIVVALETYGKKEKT